MDGKDIVTGMLYHVIFSNEENGYTVAQFEGDSEDFIAVGILYGMSEGERAELTGSWTSHPSYGEQFKVEYFKKIMPTTCEDICRYLSSGIIKGIRKATAEKIVEAFGEESLNIISQNPQELAKIKGISLHKAYEMSKSYNMNLGTSELFGFLNKYGISANACMKIYRKYKTASHEKITNNPYVLCDESIGVGFRKADEIARNSGFSASDEKRIYAGLIYCLKYALQYGHTYLPQNMLIDEAKTLLGIDDINFEEYITKLCNESKCVRQQQGDETAVYLTEYFKYENYIAQKLYVLSSVKIEKHNINMDAQIDIAQINSTINFAALQREAVRLAMTENVMVITGGPGTGKTTIINAIIDIMRSMDLKVMLSAPTGRAAKRMTQLCGLEAKTLHRLLEVRYSEDDKLECVHNESDPLEADVIIVDEMSMVDIVLMNALLKAVRPGTRLILVGDVNQLPSVGAGNVLRDIISGQKIPVIRLTEVFRQSENSLIATNAHEINKGNYPSCNIKEGDFFFASFDNADMAAQYICELCLTRLPEKYGYKSSEIQVLSPVKKGVTGVESMNKYLQDCLNPSSKIKNEKVFKNIVFREGDRVMQIRNNYDMVWTDTNTLQKGFGIFNGDVGFVAEIDNVRKILTVMYDEKEVEYSFTDLGDLSLAYCITVHKSQGSEFPVVIMPMFHAPHMLANRNLFYTGVTRAREFVVLVGIKEVMYSMIDNNREDKRYSGLMEKLNNEFEK